MREGIWQQIEEILVEEELREAIIGLLLRLFERRPEKLRKYKELGYIPKEDIVPLLGEYAEVVLEELKARGGPIRAPIELTREVEECLRTIIELYGPKEKRKRKILYPHVPKRKEVKWKKPL